MILHLTTPRDWFDDCTVTVAEWLGRAPLDETNPYYRWSQWIRACAMVSKIGRLRTEPRVGYDPVSDQHYFVFKEDNNGTTWFVAEQPLHFDVDDEIATTIEDASGRAQDRRRSR